MSTTLQGYSGQQFISDFQEIVKDDPKACVDTIVSVSDWMAYLGINRELAAKTSATFGRISSIFSLPSLIEHLNGLRDEWRVSDKKDSKELKKDTLKHATLGIASGAELGILLHETGIYTFKRGVQGLNIAVWAALGVFDIANVYHDVEEIKGLQSAYDCAKTKEEKTLINSKMNLAYLKMLQSITTVAMAAIALVSIAFEALAYGVTFHPLVMLGLGSLWLGLHFSNAVYEKVLTHRQGQMEALGLLSKKI